jgi:mono/diheme cytochrome c family protein
MRTLLLLFALCTSLFQSCTYKKYELINPPKVDSTVSYSATIAPINFAQCNSCHIPQGTGNGDFANYNGVKTKVDNGSMYLRVVVYKDMPTPGSGYTLTDEQRNQYDRWIRQGAKNN